MTALESKQTRRSTTDQDDYAQSIPTASYTVPFLYELAVIIVWLMGPIVLAVLWVIFDRQGKPIALVPCSALIAATIVAVRCMRPIPSRSVNLILTLGSAFAFTLPLASVPYLRDRSYLGYIWRARHAVLKWATATFAPFLTKALVIILPLAALLTVVKSLAEWLLPLRTYRRFIASELRGLTTKAGISLQRLYSPTQGTIDSNQASEIGVREALENSSKLLITGAAGSGKTTTMTRLALDLAEDPFRGASMAPIFIRFSALFPSIRSEKSLIDLAVQTLESAKLANAHGVFKNLAKRGRIAFLLDGFDELDSVQSSRISSELKELMGAYPECVYVASSRIVGLREGFRALFDERFAIQPMSAAAIAETARRYFRDDPSMANMFLDAYAKMPPTQLNNPLILTIMLEAFAQTGQLPRSVGDQIEWTLQRRFNATRNSSFSILQTKYLLGVFASTLRSKQASSLSKENLVNLASLVLREHDDPRDPEAFIEEILRTGIIVADDTDVSFAHRSMEEYFLSYVRR